MKVSIVRIREERNLAIFPLIKLERNRFPIVVFFFCLIFLSMAREKQTNSKNSPFLWLPKASVRKNIHNFFGIGFWHLHFSLKWFFNYKRHLKHTFTLQSLSENSIKQRTAMITKCWRHKCVHSKSMRQINFESLSQILQKKTTTTGRNEYGRAHELKWTRQLFELTIVLSELKPDSEHVPSNFSWHFLWTAVWHAEINNYFLITFEIAHKMPMCFEWRGTQIELKKKQPNWVKCFFNFYGMARMTREDTRCFDSIHLKKMLNSGDFFQ